MQGSSMLFFLLFALVLFVMYMALRRGWAAPRITAAAGVLTSVIAMVLMSLAQGNSVIQAIIVGILVGGIFSFATLAVAWYFHTSDLQQQHAREKIDPVEDMQTGTDYAAADEE